jgi:hypothetical protein
MPDRLPGVNRMVKNKLLCLAIVGIILAVVACESAFAATWSGADYGRKIDYSTAVWVQTVSNTPTVTGGSWATWYNCLANDYPDGGIGTYPIIKKVHNGQTTYDYHNQKIYYGDITWSPTVGITAVSSSGTHSVGVTYIFSPNNNPATGCSAGSTQYYTV